MSWDLDQGLLLEPGHAGRRATVTKASVAAAAAAPPSVTSVRNIFHEGSS